MAVNKRIVFITAGALAVLIVVLLICVFAQPKSEAISDANKASLLDVLGESEKYLSLSPNIGASDGERAENNEDFEDFENFDDIVVKFRKNRVNASQLYEKNGVSDDEINRAVSELISSMKEIEQVVLKVGGTKTDNSELLEAVYINNSRCAYDKASETFYFPIDLKKTDAVSMYVSSAAGSQKYVTAEILDAEGNPLTGDFVPEVKGTYSIYAVSDKYCYKYNLVFTGMPVVQINDINNIGDSYRDCMFSLTSPAPSVSDTQNGNLYTCTESAAMIHIRGASARGWPKSSYAVKLVDADGLNKDTSLLGMRTHSDWILDAMFIDMSRARNRVTTDLWNSFSGSVYYQNKVSKTISNGTHGEFVELFINNAYIGLYCFTEKIDRAQIQVKKYDEANKITHGMIYKGKAWESPLRFKSYYDYDNNSNWWGSFQQKFPNPNKGYPIDWDPMYNFVKFVVDSDDDTFRDGISDYIDIDNFVDYTIMMCFSYASDNTGKNAYWSVYDIQDPDYSKFFITIWDVKSTWGRSWNPSKTSPDSEWMDSTAEHDTAIFRKLVLTNAEGFADKLIARWNEVKVDTFSPDAVKALFNKYMDLFDESGAWEREAAKWNKTMRGYYGITLELEEEREYIMQWIDARYEYIDDFINNKLDTVGKFGTKR